MFIAKISAGRTVREFIGGTMAAPVVYTCFWLVIFGGAGLPFFFKSHRFVRCFQFERSGMRMEREAAGAGLCCHNFDFTRWLFNSHFWPLDKLWQALTNLANLMNFDFTRWLLLLTTWQRPSITCNAQWTTKYESFLAYLASDDSIHLNFLPRVKNLTSSLVSVDDRLCLDGTCNSCSIRSNWTN